MDDQRAIYVYTIELINFSIIIEFVSFRDPSLFHPIIKKEKND